MNGSAARMRVNGFMYIRNRLGASRCTLTNGPLRVYNNCHAGIFFHGSDGRGDRHTVLGQ